RGPQQALASGQARCGQSLAESSTGSLAARRSGEQGELPPRPQRARLDPTIAERPRELLSEPVVREDLGRSRRPRVADQPLEVRMIRQGERLVRPVAARGSWIHRPPGEGGG